MNNTRKRLLHVLKGTMMRYLPLMITCRECETFVHDYVGRSLPAGQRGRFQFHLSLCRECREYLIAYERTIALHKTVYAETDESLHTDAPESLMRAILVARRS